MGRGDVFKRGQGLHPGRSVFDLSYANKFSGKMGYLYPVYLEEVVPGDVFDLGAAAVVRMAPMVAPVLHEIELHYHAFFVPFRFFLTARRRRLRTARLFGSGLSPAVRRGRRRRFYRVLLLLASFPRGAYMNFLASVCLV